MSSARAANAAAAGVYNPAPATPALLLASTTELTPFSTLPTDVLAMTLVTTFPALLVNVSVSEETTVL